MNPSFDFLSKIRTTLENLWGGNAQNTQGTLQPVHITRPSSPPTSTQPQQPPMSSQPMPGQPLPPGQGIVPPMGVSPDMQGQDFMQASQGTDQMRQGLTGLLLLLSALGAGGSSPGMPPQPSPMPMGAPQQPSDLLNLPQGG